MSLALLSWNNSHFYPDRGLYPPLHCHWIFNFVSNQLKVSTFGQFLFDEDVTVTLSSDAEWNGWQWGINSAKHYLSNSRQEQGWTHLRKRFKRSHGQLHQQQRPSFQKFEQTAYTYSDRCSYSHFGMCCAFQISLYRTEIRSDFQTSTAIPEQMSTAGPKFTTNITTRTTKLPSTSTQLLSCGSGYYLNPFSNTCFGARSTGRNWTEAKKYCEDKGEFLATPHSLESASWLQQMRINKGLYLYTIFMYCISMQTYI